MRYGADVIITFTEDGICLRGPCLLWPGAHHPDQYGRTSIKVNGEKKTKTAHRIAWIRLHGFPPDDVDVHHLCGVKACVNTDHLDLAGHSEHGTMHGRPRKRAHMPAP